MEKIKLEQFISKYSLGGSVESVKWISDTNGVHVRLMSEDQTIVGCVLTTAVALDHGEYNIHRTSTLSSLLQVLESDIFVDKDAKNRLLHIKDSKNKISCRLADPAIIPTPKKLTAQFDSVIEFGLDSKFNYNFIKAKSAVQDNPQFSIISDGKTTEVVVGYNPKENTDRVYLKVDTSVASSIDPIMFSSDNLGSIITSNKDAESGTLKLSASGIIEVTFLTKDTSSQYYIARKQ